MRGIKIQKSDFEMLIDLKGERDYYKTMIGCIYGYLSIEDPSYQFMFPQSEYHDDLVTLIFAKLDEIKEKLYGGK